MNRLTEKNKQYLNAIDTGVTDLDKIVSGYTGGFCDSQVEKCWANTASNNHECDSYCLDHLDVWLYDLLSSIVFVRNLDLRMQPIPNDQDIKPNDQDIKQVQEIDLDDTDGAYHCELHISTQTIPS